MTDGAGLEGLTALVTGASRGLGRAVAARLIERGAHLVLAARDPDRLTACADELRGAIHRPGQLLGACPTDVSRVGDVESLVEYALGLTGRIDALVCCAAVQGPIGRLDESAWDDWVRTIEVDLLGTVLPCRAVLPTMRRQGRGKIVVLSGGGATGPRPLFSAYAAAKAAVVRFAETLAVEARPAGVEVNAIAPGTLPTDMLREIEAAGPARAGEAEIAAADRTLRAGDGALQTATELIAFLVSPASDGISGRLLSAIWDDWRGLPAQRDRLASSDVFTLRRIVPADRGWETA